MRNYVTRLISPSCDARKARCLYAITGRRLNSDSVTQTVQFGNSFGRNKASSSWKISTRESARQTRRRPFYSVVREGHSRDDAASFRSCVRARHELWRYLFTGIKPALCIARSRLLRCSNLPRSCLRLNRPGSDSEILRGVGRANSRAENTSYAVRSLRLVCVCVCVVPDESAVLFLDPRAYVRDVRRM